MRRSRAPLTAGVVALVLLTLVLGILAASGRRDARVSHSSRVFLFGDSLALQASPYWLDLMHKAGFNAEQGSIAGTNTCDWFDTMRRIRDSYRPTVVVFAFGGNAITPCMLDSRGHSLVGAAFNKKFHDDTERALTIFRPAAHVYLVSPPAMFDGDNRFAPTYQAIAASHSNVSFVDGGRILTPGRIWQKTLPCNPGEACNGPTVNGTRTVVVRAPDRVHFCPVKTAFGAPCPVYSPGGYRYALTIFDALRRAP
jgi:hypothetical protein